MSKCEICESDVDYCNGCDTCHACWEVGHKEITDKLESENKALKAENKHLKKCAELANDISDFNNRSV